MSEQPNMQFNREKNYRDQYADKSPNMFCRVMFMAAVIGVIVFVVWWVRG